MTIKKRLFRLSLVCTLFASSFTHAAKLTQLQVDRVANHTQATFHLDGKTQAHLFTLDHPNRLVVDLDRTQLRTALKHVPFSNTGIVQIRSGERPGGTLRVVFNLNSQVKFTHQQDNNNLIVDMYAPGTHPTPAPSMKPKPISQPEKRKSATPIKKSRPKEVIIKIPAVTAEQKSTTTPIVQSQLAKPVTPSASQVEQPKELPKSPPETLNKPTAENKIAPVVIAPLAPLQMSVVKRPAIIVIDAGHGGKDPGTVGIGGTREKDVVLAIALRLEQLINKQPNMHALLTRNGDYFVTLKDRLNLAHRQKADLFIAIHADSYFNNVQKGASVYAVARHGATTETAQWLAKNENHSELSGLDLNDLSDQSPVLRSVLIDLAQTATINDSMQMGATILNSLKRVTSIHYPQVAQAPFVVLKSPDIPSILVETGFLSTPKEEERLRTKRYRIKIANAILHGLQDYLVAYPTLASNPANTNPVA